MHDQGTFTATVFLTPGFSMMSFSSLIEPMRGANRIAGSQLFRWRLLSPAGGPVPASNGIELQTQPIPVRDEGSDMVAICGGQEDETYTDRRLREFLRHLVRTEAIVGSVGTGSFILADAGVLDGRRCTTHWDYIDAFREKYPRLDICNDIFVIDRRVFTCGGGVAAMDVMLEIVGGMRGSDFANRVRENFVYGSIRSHDESQRMSLRMRLGVANVTLIDAVGLMESHTESPLRLPVLARRVGVSQRQLERLFETWLGVAPAQYYVRVRLDRARALLRHSSMPIFDAAVACGFTSASHFSRAYRSHFGCSPSADRVRTNMIKQKV
ncbi:GlxA family transcriptional regulator [Pseudaminobacter sp. 19-2017]|uniref:GlxA family transcriptional regulator n=1 Tax=Pseudaminobacter soli (ex Zhang et al. 2022) TaxID=2831468 RepID=A0A942DV64_9HYPH|nr:GlxA family transcriptional regulator [Pseudaminobacter soli]MBS3647354.1 GlxA family transcriptional regulator [Pseudaminobacter soli]